MALQIQQSRQSKYGNQFDNTPFNKLPRLVILHQPFYFLPLINEANKKRQNTLALEKIFLKKIAGPGS